MKTPSSLCSGLKAGETKEIKIGKTTLVVKKALSRKRIIKKEGFFGNEYEYEDTPFLVLSDILQ